MAQGRHSKRDRERMNRQNARHARKRAGERTRVQTGPQARDGAEALMPSDMNERPAAPQQPVGDPLELLLTGMAPGGDALGRHEGMVIFVAGALPGERARVQLTERKASWGRARLLEVLEPAPERVIPACRHFGLCGGCTWQHVEYAAQLGFKHAIVREQLARIARLPDVEVRPCLPSPQPFGYRNTTRLATTAEGRAGYRVAGSHTVFPVQECPILEPALQADLETVRAMVLDPGDEVTLRVEADPIRVGAFDYTVSLDSFFQVNTAMAAHLVDAVMSALALQPGQRVLDLYAGVGLFTLPMAAQVGSAGHVLAVESAPSAIADGRRNSRSLPQVSWLETPVEEAVTRTELTRTLWSAILVDPPRRGVEKEALLALASLRAPTLVYVSCDPATLARDAALLTEQGYRLLSAQPLDLFPQTAHVETVATFAR